MKTRILSWYALWIALALVVWPAAAQTQLILTAPSSSINQITAQFGLTLVEQLNSEGGVYLVSAPAGVSAQQLTAELAADSSVQAVEQNATMESSEIEPLSKVTVNLAAMQTALSNTAAVNYYGSTVRSSYLNQPAASLIQTSQAHGAFPTGGPIVAVIDTGVDPTHPALVNSLVGGYDFTRNQPGIPDERLDLSPTAASTLAQSSVVSTSQKTQSFVLSQSTVVILDQSTVVILDGGSTFPSDFGHGTMVAGLIHLVAPTALIMPLKAFQANGTANLSDIIRAIYYATDNGATVISMSFDTETPSPDLTAAIQYASAHQVICVAAAGNEGQQEITYPAGIAGVIGVGSTTATDGRSVFSNYGVASVFMAAPGEALITTYPGNNYAGVWGTSFSTALVSGTAALIAQLNPSIGFGAVDPLENGTPISPTLGLGESRLNVLTTLQSAQGDQ
jgi:subtilisin family serine protease